jgi:hypothetical protein
MNQKINLLTARLITPILVLQSNPFAFGQTETDVTDPDITYAQAAIQLPNQTEMEYSMGNSTGAEELATEAYLENFEHVESPLEKKGAGELKEQIEGMMREDLRGPIRNNASTEELSSHISETGAKLMEAISILTCTR